MDRLDGFLVAAIAAYSSVCSRGNGCAGPRLAGMVVVAMKKKQPLARVELAPVPRAVTLLGAPARSGRAPSICSARIRSLSRRSGHRASQRQGAGAAGARTRRALCGGRRSGCLRRTKSRAVRLRHRSRRRRRRPWSRPRSARPTGRWRRSPARPVSRRRSPPPRGATVALANKEALVCAGALSCGGRPRPAPRCCRSIPSTTPSSSRWAPAGARPCAGSC